MLSHYNMNGEAVGHSDVRENCTIYNGVNGGYVRSEPDIFNSRRTLHSDARGNNIGYSERDGDRIVRYDTNGNQIGYSQAHGYCMANFDRNGNMVGTSGY